jgi:fucose 4-O-acetylase-like acetyltransferase
MNTKQSRNEIIDAVRGIAIILVMTGHVIGANVNSFYESTLFNIIWSLQIPLFMIISGYVTQYTKPINSLKNYMEYIGKRSLAYLLPWVVWTFLIRGILLGKTDIFSYIKYITYSMDSGYWFLFTLWTICIIFGSSNFISNKFSKSDKTLYFFTIILSIIFSFFIFLIGIFKGFNFLGIKFTLYYIPFFYSGYLYTYLQKKMSCKAWYLKFVQFIILPITIFYCFIISKINLYYISDTLINIIIRFIVSIFGCIIIFYVATKIFKSISIKVNKIFIFAGKYSLELYLVHSLLTSIIKVEPLPEFLSINGIITIIVNYILMILFSLIIIIVLSSNKWNRLIFFGKKIV